MSHSLAMSEFGVRKVRPANCDKGIKHAGNGLNLLVNNFAQYFW